MSKHLTDRELLQRALAALEASIFGTRDWLKKTGEAIESLRERLAQPAAPAAPEDHVLVPVDVWAAANRVVSYASERLAQPVDEPVARVTGVYAGRFVVEPIDRSTVLPDGMALYTHPQPAALAIPAVRTAGCTLCGHCAATGEAIKPAAQWVGLTDDDVFGLLVSIEESAVRLPRGYKQFARALEAKLKERNQ